MRILIADDESIIRMGLKAILQEMGHEVLAATNGREALEMARRRQPDLAILDIKMPFTDGLQAAKTLARIQPMPILLLTAFSEQDLIDKASDLPIHGYLIKPVEPEALSAAISVATKRFQDSQALKEKAAKLADALETRKLLDKAKARLMATGLSEEEAYKTLQQQARNGRISLRAVATAILKQNPS
ncbi:ANTAR domain-containing response regulator [Candidatus Leptofilum sp.]|uniref:ANTAR domain-containing response regulator n=1 Tax=Candidatus Leptofilum sp. TaxID=3241576 RepID=UPI003B5B57E4